MPLIVQDVIVTAMALGAIGLVVRRVFGVVSPPAGKGACDACSTCPAPRTPRDDSQPIPITIVNR